MSPRWRRALQDDLHGARLNRRLPDAHAQVGRDAHQRGRGGRVWGTGESSRYRGAVPVPGHRDCGQRIPASFDVATPGTLVTYHVTAAPIVDFRHGYHPAQWSPLWEEFFCDWRELWFNQRVEPPSWVLADEAIAAGAKGILCSRPDCPPPAQTSFFTPSCWAQLMPSWSMIQPAHCPRTRIPGHSSRA